jgi:beta-galactosidase
MLDSVPEGYTLYAYDDCGVVGRQPHVLMADSYLWTFNTSDTDAGLKERSAVFSYKAVTALYENLDPKLDYVLALTYASDHVYNRVQSLSADDIEVHPPLPLPKAKTIRVIVKVPHEATADGKMLLEIKIHGEVNATASIIELWANGSSPQPPIRFEGVSGSYSELTGRLLDLAYDGVPNAEVHLSQAGNLLATANTDSSGYFTFPREAFAGLRGNVEITAKEISMSLPVENLFFDPIHYRPIPEGKQVSLDGEWRINPTPPEDARTLPLDDKTWGKIKVPGQWLQQGYDVPQDKLVAMAREFAVPRDWAGKRVILRFDSIHAGTDYWVNGKRLGYSENLFTPVEWDVTDLVHVGASNRLDLRMTVATVSETLSYSSGYAFHSLGGIDRSVRLFALPETHIKGLHISTDLDKDYKDAQLILNLAVDGPADGLSVKVSIGKTQSVHELAPEIRIPVANPLKWNAEKPNLYRLVIELQKDGKVLETIERNVGFRKIEIKDRQLLINGVKVKLAGACRHEIDPLTGRADTMHLAEGDVKLLKAANLNYIRTSHYPPPQELLDACDRLGMYVEVEAPFCWVGPRSDMEPIKEVLTPTSAMIDYHHAHPSVIIWSLANESHFNKFFEVSNELVKKLDPTRPTTFNNPDPEEICDLANVHYPPMPWHEQYKDNPRPILIGEYWFPVCHDQTDVMINPGLREYFGMGQAEPDSDFSKAIAAEYLTPVMKSCAMPGAWSGLYHSDHFIGGAIWAAFDEPFYFPADGGIPSEGGTRYKQVGYAWVHGFWGLIDGWRRPKPEWWLAKLIFSPVWFPQRHVDFQPGQTSIRVPIENRYSFTDFSELKFAWECGGKKGNLKVSLPPASQGEVEIRIPPGTSEGAKIVLRVTDAKGELINTLAIHLGQECHDPLPQPSGMPGLTDDGKTITTFYGMKIDRATGKITNSPVTKFPSVHVTRYDFGDLAGPNSPPYAVFPDEKTRTIDKIDIEETPQGLKITIHDHYDLFAGWISWLIDKDGVGKVSYDYAYSGEEMNTREAGIRFALKPECDTVWWNRWSEWDIYPDDFIGRTQGSARAWRDKKYGKEEWNKRPTWPWSKDQTEMGTNDFRSVKYNIYEASLINPKGEGLAVHANADVHVRPAMSKDAANLHILSYCRLGQIVLKKGDHLTGEFTVREVID